MKNFTLLAAVAALAVSANAQNVDPTLKTVTDQGKVASAQYLALDEASVAALEISGAKVQNFGPNDVDRYLYVWEGTLNAAETTIPGVGDHFDGYPSFTVGNVGWSGAGYNINKNIAGNSTETWNDQTHFHMAYCSPSVVCPSLAIIINDQDGKNTPAKVSLGAPFEADGVTCPVVGEAAKDDWQGIDLTFADLKKLYPSFAWDATPNYTGNILSFLCGGVAGQSFALDAAYFYNFEDAGIADVNADNAAWVVTDKTVNLNGANGIELFDLSGKLVKSTNGCVLGLNNLNAGLYIAKGARSACKVLVK